MRRRSKGGIVLLGAVVVNLFGEVELWDDIDQYLDGFPPKKVMSADEISDPNMKVDLGICSDLYSEDSV